jgi:hypothetical protein
MAPGSLSTVAHNLRAVQPENPVHLPAPHMLADESIGPKRYGSGVGHGGEPAMPAAIMWKRLSGIRLKG